MNSDSRGQVVISLIIAVIAIASFMLVGGTSKHHVTPKDKAVSAIPNPENNSNSNTDKSGLQLKTLKFISSTPIPTVTPPPTNACNHDNAQQAGPSCTCSAYLIVCADKKCVNVLPSELLPNGGTCQDINQVDSSISYWSNWCGVPELAGDGNGTYCLGKPVIYLYPTTTTLVDVSVTTPGKIVVSDPLYPTGGWMDVEAHPDGKLIYDGKQYLELFYESEVTNFLKPTNGIIISNSQLEKTLDKIIFQLGLNNIEKQEFLDFWIPKLHALNSPFILFSVIDKQAKEAIDQINISPEPTTRIEFIAYFKPLHILTSIDPLILPKRPERIGFTSVEWGGVIDNNEVSLTLK